MNSKSTRREKTIGRLFCVIVVAVAVLFLVSLITVINLFANGSHQTQEMPTQQVSQIQYVCNACGKPLYQAELQAHMKQHYENGDNASYRTITSGEQN